MRKFPGELSESHYAAYFTIRGWVCVYPRPHRPNLKFLVNFSGIFFRIDHDEIYCLD